MKKLLITLMLLSPFSFADWGDVYYCQMTSLVDINSDGTVEKYQLQTFQFKLESTTQAMVFGKGNYFSDSKMPLNLNKSLLTQDYWRASDDYSMLQFDDGRLFYSAVGVQGITSISANCDKFV